MLVKLSLTNHTRQITCFHARVLENLSNDKQNYISNQNQDQYSKLNISTTFLNIQINPTTISSQFKITNA